MTKSSSHKKAQNKAAGKKGETEKKLKGGGYLDAINESGKKATEVERSDNPSRLEKAAKRLKESKAKQKVLQVPQKNMNKAADAMKKIKISGTVKNMGGTKSIKVKI